MFKIWMIAVITTFLITACGTNAAKEDDTATDQPVSIANTENNISEDNETTVANKVNNNSVDITNPTVSMKDAVDIFKESYPDAKIESIELDTDSSGRLHYDIDGFDETKEYDVEIDATTKEIIVNEVERERTSDEAIDFSAIIDPAEAIEIASTKTEVEGLSATGWSLEVENGKQTYTVEYERNNSDIDIKIDATNGEILEVDIDD